MFGHVLVPLDGSPEGASAIPAAHVLAALAGARITLVTAVPPQPSADERAFEDAAAYLSRVGRELSAADSHPLDVVVRRGDPAAAILEEVDAGRADLVVMATRRWEHPAQPLVRSVAEEVAARSPAPVVLVRPGGRRLAAIKTILVPVDGTSDGAPALRIAVDMARASGARLVVVQVVPRMPLFVSDALRGTRVARYLDPAWVEAEQARASAYVEGLAARLRRAGLDAEGTTPGGVVAQTIAETAAERGADLIVMSTRARRGVSRALLGSVAADVVRFADRPVLLVRRGARAARPPRGGRAEGTEQPRGLSGAAG
jgi:nucleotide-binding universal stress UspA family protein